jgi:hypothetical protein
VSDRERVRSAIVLGAITELLAARPATSAADIRTVLRIGGLTVSSAEVTTALRNGRERFRSSGDSPVVWTLKSPPGRPSPQPQRAASLRSVAKEPPLSPDGQREHVAHGVLAVGGKSWIASCRCGWRKDDLSSAVHAAEAVRRHLASVPDVARRQVAVMEVVGAHLGPSLRATSKIAAGDWHYLGVTDIPCSDCPSCLHLFARRDSTNLAVACTSCRIVAPDNEYDADTVAWFRQAMVQFVAASGPLTSRSKPLSKKRKPSKPSKRKLPLTVSNAPYGTRRAVRGIARSGF